MHLVLARNSIRQPSLYLVGYRDHVHVSIGLVTHHPLSPKLIDRSVQRDGNVFTQHPPASLIYLPASDLLFFFDYEQ